MIRHLINRIFMDRFHSVVGEGDSGESISTLRVGGISLECCDFKESTALASIYKELSRNQLGMQTLQLPAKAKIIDIGGHVGSMSIYLAKRFPDAEIHAFEAYDLNYAHLLKNLELNGVTNVKAHNLAITHDGRSFQMLCGRGNTGGSTGCSAKSDLKGKYQVDSITLDQAFEDLGGCDLLKIDCEGVEHEILNNAQCLNSIKNIVGEFHMNDHLRGQGYDSEQLLAQVRQKVVGHVGIKCIEMCA